MALSCGAWHETHSQQEDVWPEIQVSQGDLCPFGPFVGSEMIQQGTVT